MSETLDTSNFISHEIGVDVPAPEQPKAEPETQEAAAEPADAEIETPAAEGDDAQPPKVKKTAQERIDELTRARREAEREAAHWRKLAEQASPAKAAEESVEAGDGAPDPDTFDYGEADPKYIAALVAHETKKAIDADRLDRAQSEQDQAQARVWEAAHEAARAKFADFDEVVMESAKRNEWPLSREMYASAMEAESPGDVLHHLATNPGEARRIAALSPLSQAREIGKLEARLTEPAASTAPKPKTATDAPIPPETGARGAGGRFTVSPDTDDFAAFEASIASKWAN